jgi:hypothetical protein
LCSTARSACATPGRKFRPAADGNCEYRSVRAAGRADPEQRHCRPARARAARGSPRHGAARRRLHRDQGELNPPLRPLRPPRPRRYDFARDLYFQHIGASGLAQARSKVVTPPEAASVRLRANAVIQGLRYTIDQRIRSVLSGDVGSIASALIYRQARCDHAARLRRDIRVRQLADGWVVSYALAPDAFEEDCRRAAVTVAIRDEPPDCTATVIGRSV